MFKILSSRQEDPGFENAILMVSKSHYWLTVDSDGNQLPPVGIAAVDSKIASSPIVAKLVANGSVVVQGDTSKPKKKNKAETDTTPLEVVKVVDVPQVELENLVVEVEPKIDIETNSSKSEIQTIVAESADEKQVSSNKNIVNQN